MSSCGIYKITSPSGKIYVGESKHINKRWKKYYNYRCKEQHLLYRSLKKYGVENHTFEIIEECDFDDLKCRERYWQDYYDVLGEKGLNLKLTGCGEEKQVHSEETILKMKSSHKDKKLSEEHIKNISLNHASKKEGWVSPLLGKGGTRLGMNNSEEHNEKLSKTRVEKQVAKGDKNPRAKKVENIITGEILDCAKDLCKILDIKYPTLMAMLGGYNSNKTDWRFKN